MVAMMGARFSRSAPRALARGPGGGCPMGCSPDKARILLPLATLFPIRGAGFHELNRGGFKALEVYNAFKDTPRAKEIMDKIGSPPADRKAALLAHKAG